MLYQILQSYKDQIYIILEAKRLLGMVYNEQGHYDQACQQFEQVLAMEEATTQTVYQVAFEMA